jgi:Ca2+-dependent lipid-binding protein
MLKGTKIYSMFTGTCPVCQSESMYKESNPYKLNKIFQMHERCSHCNTKYKIEPSFFYGAMYVSYGVGIAFAVAAFVIAFLFFGGGLMTSFYAIIGTLVVFMPVIMRLSRNIWINIFMHYDKKKAEK